MAALMTGYSPTGPPSSGFSSEDLAKFTVTG